MLSFAYRRFDGVMPEPSELDDEDRCNASTLLDVPIQSSVHTGVLAARLCMTGPWGGNGQRQPPMAAAGYACSVAITRLHAM